jgi:hypothetical protein
MFMAERFIKLLKQMVQILGISNKRNTAIRKMALFYLQEEVQNIFCWSIRWIHSLSQGRGKQNRLPKRDKKSAENTCHLGLLPAYTLLPS